MHFSTCYITFNSTFRINRYISAYICIITIVWLYYLFCSILLHSPYISSVSVVSIIIQMVLISIPNIWFGYAEVYYLALYLHLMPYLVNSFHIALHLSVNCWVCWYFVNILTISIAGIAAVITIAPVHNERSLLAWCYGAIELLTIFRISSGQYTNVLMNLIAIIKMIIVNRRIHAMSKSITVSMSSTSCI
jgi:hypothetical protein